MMEFFFFGRICRSAAEKISLHDVWAVAKGELNSLGEATLKKFGEDDELGQQHRVVAWQSQSVIEFVDLLGAPVPHIGRYQHINYLYFEALSSLRESIISGLNGSTRASLSILRSAFEMFLLHCWWQERLFLKETFEPFYDWLSGKKPRPAFKNIVHDNFKAFNLPKSDLTFKVVMDTYAQLCAYVHAPLLHESITTINAGNRRIVTKEVLLHWLSITKLALSIILEHLIFHKPMSLFPVDINKKFAFSPPVGIYFDKYNIVALRAALGAELYEKYREGAKGMQIIKDLTNFYEHQEDKTEQQILDTWSEEEVRDFGNDVPEDIEARWALVKSRHRALVMSLSYGDMATAFSMTNWLKK